MKKRIFTAILVVAVSALLSSLALIVGVLYDYLQERAAVELASQAIYVAHGMETGGEDYLEALPTATRVTWIAEDGTVLFDNRENTATMGNHAGRQEIRLAMETGEGSATRQSDTLAQMTLYYAMRLPDGTVLRLAETQYSAWMMVLQALRPVLLVMLLALVLAAWLAGRLSRQLVAPINAIDLKDPREDMEYEELAPLVERLRSQKQQIRRQMDDLRRHQEEFAAITKHMSEGLIVIDRDGRVLSCNAAARTLLGAEAPAEGGSVLDMEQGAGFRRCVEEALAGRRQEELLERNGECRRVFSNPVTRDGRLTGAVLIVLDVTEKEQRETLRREFTANVSHELKTPLTGILGTAEIMRNGLVKQEDIPHFAGNIHREAQRLIELVNDIIKISRLDEGGPTTQWETVDLRAAAEKVTAKLALAAEQKGVTLNIRGTGALVRSVPQIVEEVIFNLCDNAIVYNVPGGQVDITVVNAVEPRVIVADTGMGIPREAQSRIFERFYRVDKSHSGNGTGLGLSIVKHGAAYLGARVELVSEVGKGSSFTLIFPQITQ